MIRKTLGSLAILALLCGGCASKPPELRLLQSKTFPVYAPSTVQDAMGSQSGDSMNDPQATHSMCYWLQSESKKEDVVKFYKDKMSSLPGAKEVTGEEKYDGSEFQMTCKAPPGSPDKVESMGVIVEKEQKDGKTIFRVTESLKPGVLYPKD